MAAFTAQDVRVRGSFDDLPQSVPLVLSGSYTATASAEFGLGPNATKVEATVVQTSGTATPAYTVGIDAWNPADSTWENLITSASVASTGAVTTAVQVNPDTPSVTNVSAQRLVRRKMRVTVTHTNATAAIYSVNVHAS